MNGTHDTVGRLPKVDLNLIVVFDALAAERSVTRAGVRLGVTQSAVSHALARLRDLFEDPLLVRGAGGMVLTPRAESLVAPLRAGLISLSRALAEPTEFEPARSSRSFGLASPDLFDMLILPPLLEHIRTRAPGVTLVVSALDPVALAPRMETGELDLAIVPRLAGEPQLLAPGRVRRRLFRDGFVCLLRRDHPALARRSSLSRSTYTKLSHVLVSPTGAGPGVVDAALQQGGASRRVALRLPSFGSALAIVERSDLVLTGPSALAKFASKKLRAVAPPLKLPRHDVDMVWHERFTNDSGHRWLRDALVDVCRTTYAGE